MKKSTPLLGLLLLVSALLLIAGCAAHKIEKAEFSGFLGDYSGLTMGTEEQAVMVYRKPGVDLKPYSRVMLDRVVIWPNPDSEYQGLDPDELKELSDYFNQALVDALKDGYELVDQPGPGVMHIRTAITDVVPGKPVSGTLSSIIPVGMVISGTKRAVSDTSIGVGQAAVEVEILDAQTGERLGAAVDRRAGGQRAFKGKLVDAKDAFDYWAKRIRLRLDQERGV